MPSTRSSPPRPARSPASLAAASAGTAIPKRRPTTIGYRFRTPTVPLVVSASRADAVVVAGTGLGNTTAELGEAVAEADWPVIVASRCHAGPTEPVYGTQGGAATLAESDHVRFAHGTPWAARIELVLAVAADRVEKRFDGFDA